MLTVHFKCFMGCVSFARELDVGAHEYTVQTLILSVRGQKVVHFCYFLGNITFWLRFNRVKKKKLKDS